MRYNNFNPQRFCTQKVHQNLEKRLLFRNLETTPENQPASNNESPDLKESRIDWTERRTKRQRREHREKWDRKCEQLAESGGLVEVANQLTGDVLSLSQKLANASNGSDVLDLTNELQEAVEQLQTAREVYRKLKLEPLSDEKFARWQKEGESSIQQARKELTTLRNSANATPESIQEAEEKLLLQMNYKAMLEMESRHRESNDQ